MRDNTPGNPDDEARAAGPGSAKSDAQLSRHAIHGFLWILSTGAAQGVVQILTLVLLARLLGPTPFGIAGGALIVMRVADTLPSPTGIPDMETAVSYVARQSAMLTISIRMADSGHALTQAGA